MNRKNSASALRGSACPKKAHALRVTLQSTVANLMLLIVLEVLLWMA